MSRGSVDIMQWKSEDLRSNPDVSTPVPEEEVQAGCLLYSNAYMYLTVLDVPCAIMRGHK